MSDVTETARTGRRGREPSEPSAGTGVVDAVLAEELVARAREQGVELLGENGLLRQMTKAILERGLAEELTEHLGYEPHERAGAGNARNGTTSKRVHSEAGTIDLDVPRDRAGTFEPRLVRKGQRRLDGIDKIVIGLYARGMTVRDIRAHLAEIYDVEVSPDLISTITDAVLDEVREWQARPLDRVYPVIFLDAIICKVRTEGTVRNKAAHLAVGVDVEGRKEVLGIWVEHTEGAKFWLRVMNDLKARGVEDVLIVVCDGLVGLPAAITAVWPEAIVQTCVVHLVRASMRWVNYKDRKKVAAQLRSIYAAPTEQAARDALDAWTDSDIGRQYPAIKRQWEAAWEHVIPFFEFPPEVRKVIYTTNMIESINYQLRKITKTRGHFPTDDALIKLLYLGCREIGVDHTRQTAGRSLATGSWRAALNQFDLMFPGRLDRA
ncbi:IS256 family transposase [Cellulomonas endophytica]|uniref:IS256 family transposase n=1 Tax=Cellulomonas endophytica TaxID=2494735 RepID=UPI00101270B4|nr:IS256 family transposase [Cellulomonas endophytica]